MVHCLVGSGVATEADCNYGTPLVCGHKYQFSTNTNEVGGLHHGMVPVLV